MQVCASCFLCFSLLNGCSLHLSLPLLSSPTYIYTARPYDFTTGVVYDRYDPEQNEACVSLAIVDSVDVELPESLLVEIELREPNPVIRMSPDMSVGYIQIMDDDSMSKYD